MGMVLSAIGHLLFRAWETEVSWRSSSTFGIILEVCIPVGVFLFTMLCIRRGWFGMATLRTTIADLSKAAIVTVVVLTGTAILIFMVAIPVTIYRDHRALLSRIHALQTENESLRSTHNKSDNAYKSAVSPCQHPLPFHPTPIGIGPPFIRDVEIVLLGTTDLQIYTDVPFAGNSPGAVRPIQANISSINNTIGYIDFYDTPPNQVEVRFTSQEPLSVVCIERLASNRWVADIVHHEYERSDTPAVAYTEMLVSVAPTRIATQPRLRFYFDSDWGIEKVYLRDTGAPNGPVETPYHQVGSATIELTYNGVFAPNLPVFSIDGKGKAPHLTGLKRWGVE
jgi:hypothetical protein